MMYITWIADGYAGSNTLEWHVCEPLPELPAPGRILSIQADEDEVRAIMFLLKEKYSR
jgi:hypothetical protein